MQFRKKCVFYFWQTKRRNIQATRFPRLHRIESFIFEYYEYKTIPAHGQK